MTSATAGPKQVQVGLIGWFRIIAASFARMLLIVVATLLLWAAMPAVVGGIPTTVRSDSMAPGIRTGDVVVAMPANGVDLALHQVLLVNDPDHPGRLRLHRLAVFDDHGRLILRGDANPSNDSSPVARADVRGVAFLRVPFIGIPVVWIAEGNIVGLVGLGGVLAGVIVASRLDRRYLVEPHPRAEAPRPRGGRMQERLRRGRGSRALRRSRTLHRARQAVGWGALSVALVVLTAASSVIPAYAALTAVAANPLSTFVAACPGPLHADSPYFSYLFSETSGDIVADSSGNARTGTLVGAAATGHVAESCATPSSPSLQLDGLSAQVTTPTLLTGPALFSQEMWFKTTTIRGGKLIGFGNQQSTLSTTADRHIYMTNSGTLVFGVISGGAARTIVSAAAYNDGVWHHVVSTLSSAGMLLYVDGALVVKRTQTTSADAYSGYWRIGYDKLSGWSSAPTDLYFTGTIDSVAVYTAALTATQVSAHFAAGH